MLTVTLSSLLLASSLSHTAATQVSTFVQEASDEQARVPDALVFFAPKSSLLSPLAAEVVATAARHADPGTIVLVQASSDHEGDETAQTAVERADAVRLELMRNGVPATAIRIMHAGVSGTGIESRRVIISIISSALSSPHVATVGAVPALAL
jgi:outer membrane protein OmpA-like peptidoglycan-associated protein